MTRKGIFAATLVWSVQHVWTQQLPYNPTALLRQGDTVYVVSPSTSNQFYTVDVSQQVGASNAIQTTTNTLPFLSGNASIAYLPLAGHDDVTVLAGDCSDPSHDLALWRYNFSQKNNASWSKLSITSIDSSLAANYLAAGFSFSPTDSSQDESLFVFGGMCPDGPSNASSWASDAAYSNTMMTFANDDNSNYQMSLTGQRAPPVAEAGLTITPLAPTFSNTSTGTVSQQQNFVLVGGHTQNAFLNMSQVALFSLPQQSWSFVGVDQPNGGTVEPRSGHSAVMTEDGSKIIVLGGWVGSIANPASPQLAILDIAAGYGGNGNWAWTIPQQTASPFGSGQGIYGHGAVMLEGGVMMVSGGNAIGTPISKAKRTNASFQFYNVTSSKWIQSYTNPSFKTAATAPTSSGLKTGQKAGLGVGLGVGIAAAVVVAVILFFLLRRHKLNKKQRERELREMALGVDKHYEGDLMAGGIQSRVYPEMRSTSWANRQEHDSSPNTYPWAPIIPKRQNSTRSADDNDDGATESRPIDSTGTVTEIPSPTRGLRRSLHSRGNIGLSSHFPKGPAGLGTVFRIDEEEEERSRQGSVASEKSQSSLPLSNPFRDPPETNILESPSRENPAAQRQQEVATWVEDWQSAAESMTVSRSPSKANSRTWSNLSAYQSNYSSNNDGRASSPDKSDRTSSNLSERSNRSNLSTHKTRTDSITRTLSQRSTSAGYALFTGAAAAMSRFAGRPISQNGTGGIDRSASKRSISHGDLSQHAFRKRNEANLLQDMPQLVPTVSREDDNRAFWTPPESPIKDYKNRSRNNSFTSALNRLGKSGKRILTGVNNVDVEGKVADIESRENTPGQNSPVRADGEMSQMGRSISTGSHLSPAIVASSFWQPKQGASGWNDSETLRPSTNSDIRRRSGRLSAGLGEYGNDTSLISMVDTENEDWDIESAVQKRVVQVMFTVPKEKLRVVNADALSLISRSDTNASRDSQEERDKEMLKRMSALTERDEEGEAAVRRYSQSGAVGVEPEEKGKYSVDKEGVIGRAL